MRGIFMKKDMRVAVTKRMLREGMFRCLETRPLSKITVSDLCRESGINRATFYNHYEMPSMILREIAYEYDRQFYDIYEKSRKKGRNDDSAALEGCFAFISERKEELKLLFSEHAEHYLNGICMEIINEKVLHTAGVRDEYLLKAAAAAAAVYGFIQILIKYDIEKKPKELVEIFKSVVTCNVLE